MENDPLLMETDEAIYPADLIKVEPLNIASDTEEGEIVEVEGPTQRGLQQPLCAQPAAAAQPLCAQPAEAAQPLCVQPAAAAAQPFGAQPAAFMNYVDIGPLTKPSGVLWITYNCFIVKKSVNYRF